MIIFLYGQNNYRSKEKLNEIIAKYRQVHKSGLNLRWFDFAEKNFPDLYDEFRNVSMFSEKKLFILTNAFLNKEFKEKFIKKIKIFADSKNIILFYEEKDLPKNDVLFKVLIKNGKAQNFKLLNGLKLKNWIKKEFENRNASIDSEALDCLIDFAGNDSWRLASEIAKLSDFKKQEKEVCLKDVKFMVKPEIETNIFKTIDAIAEKDKKKAISLVHEHLGKGDSPLYLFSMVQFQFRNLLSIMNLMEKNIPYWQILKESGINSYVAKKSYYQAQKFSFLELKKIYYKLFKIDCETKNGQSDPLVALDVLISEL